MNELNALLVVVCVLAVVLGLLSNPLRRSPLTEPMIGIIIGVLLGAEVTNAVDIYSSVNRVEFIEQATRITLAIGLMGTALRITASDIRQHLRPVLLMLGIVMPVMWLVSSGLVYGIMGFSFWTAMLVGAVVTPTDPVLANSIVTGEIAEKEAPARSRHVISAEAGFNDGLALPLVFLPLLILMEGDGQAIEEWLVDVIALDVGFAILIGMVVGVVAGRLLRLAEQRQMIENTSLLIFSVALSLAVLGSVSIAGSNGILAVFISGIVFSNEISSAERLQEERIQEAINRMLTIPVFVLIGLALPIDGWLDLGWEGVALICAVLLLRRLPAVITVAPLFGRGYRLPDALYIGWFGPIGIAAIYYATLVERSAGMEQAWIIGSLVVVASTFVHGMTSTPFVRLYGHVLKQADARVPEDEKSDSV